MRKIRNAALVAGLILGTTAPAVAAVTTAATGTPVVAAAQVSSGSGPNTFYRT